MVEVGETRPSFTKLFQHTKFVNAMKRHSTANFVLQLHVVSVFVKLASGDMSTVIGSIKFCVSI